MNNDPKTCHFCGMIHRRSHRYCAPCHARKMREWRKSHRAVYDERSRARQLVNQRKHRGTLIPPVACTCCGMDGRVEMHHPDYTKPAEVLWLCRRCHLAQHGMKPAPDVSRETMGANP